jgi:hypothetical protein
MIAHQCHIVNKKLLNIFAQMEIAKKIEKIANN